MLRAGLRMLLALGFALVTVITQSPPATAAEATFTITVKSVYLKAQPGFGAEAVQSAFRDQQYAVVGRTADNTWLQLDFAGASGGPPWAYSGWGSVSGYLTAVPVTGSPQAFVVNQPQPVVAAVASVPNPSVFVQYTVAVKSLFGLAAPNWQAAWIASLFNGQTYPALAQSTDGLWLRLALGGGTEAWVASATGTVQGPAAQLPAQDTPVATAAPPAPQGIPASAGPVLPTVSARARAIYKLGLSLGNNPRAFSKIGDCNSVAPYFLAPFDKGDYSLGSTYAYLQATIDNFDGSFDRDGAAAHIGLNVDSVVDPDWADPRLCQEGETPLACEVRIQRPSIAFISLGTNGSWATNAQYETGMRRILDYLIGHGVVPILSTKADNLEGGDRFNQIVIQLAGEYQLPLWDFASAARAMPGDGLADTYHPTWGRAFFDNGPLFAGWQVRNLTALQSLDIVWHGVR